MEFLILVAHDQQALPIPRVPTLAAHNQLFLSIDQDVKFDFGCLQEEPTCSYIAQLNSTDNRFCFQNLTPPTISATRLNRLSQTHM